MVNLFYCKSGYLRIGGNYVNYVVILNFVLIIFVYMVKKKKFSVVNYVFV